MPKTVHHRDVGGIRWRLRIECPVIGAARGHSRPDQGAGHPSRARAGSICASRARACSPDSNCASGTSLKAGIGEVVIAIREDVVENAAEHVDGLGRVMRVALETHFLDLAQGHGENRTLAPGTADIEHMPAPGDADGAPRPGSGNPPCRRVRESHPARPRNPSWRRRHPLRRKPCARRRCRLPASRRPACSS